jgi:uncharacterized protein (DUF1810 family)
MRDKVYAPSTQRARLGLVFLLLFFVILLPAWWYIIFYQVAYPDIPFNDADWARAMGTDQEIPAWTPEFGELVQLVRALMSPISGLDADGRAALQRNQFIGGPLSARLRGLRVQLADLRARQAVDGRQYGIDYQAARERVQRREETSRLQAHLDYQSGGIHRDLPSWEQAKREIDAGRKVSHWMWYVFPSLGTVRPRSRNHSHLILRDEGEARAYIGVDLLRSRLEDITTAAAQQLHQRVSARVLFGDSATDVTKFWECITVFFLITADHLEWRDLHDACDYALSALHPDREGAARLNERARSAFFPVDRL